MLLEMVEVDHLQFQPLALLWRHLERQSTTGHDDHARELWKFEQQLQTFAPHQAGGAEQCDGAGRHDERAGTCSGSRSVAALRTVVMCVDLDEREACGSHRCRCSLTSSTSGVSQARCDGEAVAVTLQK